jgi:hypothetical protein
LMARKYPFYISLFPQCSTFCCPFFSSICPLVFPAGKGSGRKNLVRSFLYAANTTRAGWRPVKVCQHILLLIRLSGYK